MVIKKRVKTKDKSINKTKKKSTKKNSIKKSIKKSTKKKTVVQRLNSLELKQDETLSLLKQLLKEEKEIERDEEIEIDLQKKQIDQSHAIHIEEAEELAELKKLEELELEIQKQTKDSPLKRVTIRDMTKGIIGAFFGIVGHFAFAKGVEIGAHFSTLQTILLFITAFIIVIIFLYVAGFRKINDQLLFKVLPIRAIVIYFSAMITIPIVLLLYGKISLVTPMHEVLGIIAAISILAVIGAGTADLIGRGEE
ncbi:TIGR02587 family membrane protein [Candidatus Woesearchaeota archaeon]|nr:TIGR02587 family membrane protein [Candidatus Woesearchaeota archaeon]MCF8013824.1 TIGR02587 family membrane protein [Candidatus Woesearchaeota archaeon]